MSQSCQATIKAAQIVQIAGGGLQSPGVICGLTGVRGPPAVLQDMKTPDEVMNKPALDDIDIERINNTLRNIAEKLSQASENTIYVGGPARFTGDSEDSFWYQTGIQRNILLARYWNVIRTKLELAGWELTQVRRWFNSDHPRGWTRWICSKYWRVRPSLDHVLQASMVRHKERTLCEEMGVSEMGETA